MSILLLTTGADNLSGSASEVNAFRFTPSTLQATDTITGGATGANFDYLHILAGGTITAAQFAGVTNMEQLRMSNSGNNVTIPQSLVAGSARVYFQIFGGPGDDTIDASAVSSKLAFRPMTGADTLIGGSGNDYFYFLTSDLTLEDSAAGGSGIDWLYLNGSGALAADALTNFTGFERIKLDLGGNSLTLNATFTAGSSTSRLLIQGGSGDDSIDASALASPIAFHLQAGTDSIISGSGNDEVHSQTSDLTSADSANGGNGTDVLFLSGPGALAANALDNFSGFEAIALDPAGNSLTLTANITSNLFYVRGSSAIDVVDATGAANRVGFESRGGADEFLGGEYNDVFFLADDSFTLIDGNGGHDKMTIYDLSQPFNVTANANKIHDMEAIVLQWGGELIIHSGDIDTMNPTSQSLFVYGWDSASVTMDSAWILQSSSYTDEVNWPGFTWFEYHNGTETLYVADTVPIINFI